MKKKGKNSRIIGVILLAIGALAILVAFPHVGKMINHSSSDGAIAAEYDKINSANIGK